MSDIETACLNLRGHLFGLSYNNDGAGFIGIGKDEIHVYMRCRKSQWRSMKYDSWEGYPVKWHWGVGEVVAQVQP